MLVALACFHMLEDARDCLGLGDFADHTKSPPTVGTHTAAVAIRGDVPILHMDADFDILAQHTTLQVDVV